MFFGFRKGESNVLTSVIGVILAILFFIIAYFYTTSILKGDGSSSTLGGILVEVIDGFIELLNNTVGRLIGSSGLEPELALLRILVFVLISVIVVGSISSIKIFGEGESSKWTNLLVGLIVSIIGVRFLPPDMWKVLTAPSSAFVFAVMMGLPLVALIFVITNIKVEIVRKIIVMAYIVSLGWLFFLIVDPFYRTFALVFMAIALLLMFTDSLIIKYMRREYSKSALASGLSATAAGQLVVIENQIKDLINKKSSTSNKALKGTLQKEIDRLQEDYKDISGRYFYK